MRRPANGRRVRQARAEARAHELGSRLANSRRLPCLDALRSGRSRGAQLVALASVSGSALGAEGGTNAFRRVVVARGLVEPLQVTAPRSERFRLYVVEQRGTVRVIDRGKLRSGFFLDVRSRITAGGEQGLLGLAFDPRYATNRLIYVDYTDENGDTRVVRYKTNGTRAIPASARVLLGIDQPYANHNGGGLAFGPDGYLYVGTGDGGSGGDPENRAQNMQSLLGKMLRLDVRRPGAAPEIVALGLRNPWRYSFDRLTGDLYIGDVGQGEIEEVDYTPRSSPGLENYGWDVYEGSRRFEEKAAGPGELVFPIFEYRTARVHGGRRVRLPRQGTSGRARSIHLRRLLLGNGVEPARDRRRSQRGPHRAVQHPEPHVVRRERRRRALRDVARGRRVSDQLSRARTELCSRRFGRAKTLEVAASRPLPQRLLARSSSDARGRLPERRVGERVQRLLQIVEFARDERGTPPVAPSSG